MEITKALFYIIVSSLWGWGVDRTRSDRVEVIGGLFALIGAFVIMYWPRGKAAREMLQ